MPFIQYRDENGKKCYYELPEDRMAIFGREEHTDFQLALDPLISREHFAIEVDKDKVFLIDLGAMNGTSLNGQKLNNQTVELANGDEIRAGSLVFYYYRSKPVEKEPLEDDYYQMAAKPKKVPSTRQTQQDIFNEVADIIINKEEDKKRGFGELMKEILGNKKKK
jgi:pSer/pThr/pTyr-binding forkhead associated (FHA) protein